MNYFIICFLVSIFCFFTDPLPLYGKDVYVNGVVKVILRTGPKIDNKIIDMLDSGTKLQLINHLPDWSLVKTMDGKKGWILTRFLTEEIPLPLIVEQLKKENTRLTLAIEEAQLKSKALIQRNNILMNIESLEQGLNNDKKIWFFSGAGVFIVGILLGFSSRPKKRNSRL